VKKLIVTDSLSASLRHCNPLRTHNSVPVSSTILRSRSTPLRRSNTKNNPSPTNSSRSSRASKSLPTPSRLPPRRCKPTTSPSSSTTCAPDDPRAQNALFAISVSDFRLATATADIEHLWEFDGMAQFGEYGKGSHSLLPASERADYHQRNPWLQHCQCCWAVADCRTGSHR